MSLRFTFFKIFAVYLETIRDTPVDIKTCIINIALIKILYLNHFVTTNTISGTTKLTPARMRDYNNLVGVAVAAVHRFAVAVDADDAGDRVARQTWPVACRCRARCGDAVDGECAAVAPAARCSPASPGPAPPPPNAGAGCSPVPFPAPPSPPVPVRL